MTSAKLYDFTVNGTAITLGGVQHATSTRRCYPASSFTYMATAAKGMALGEGFRMLQTFNLDAGVVGHDGHAQERLHAADLPGEPAEPDDHRRHGRDAGAHARLDQMVDVDGEQRARRQFKENYITSAIVGHFAETPEQLEKKFLNLDMIATKYYRADIVTGTSLDFTTLKDSDGRQLPRRRRRRAPGWWASSAATAATPPPGT